MRWAPIFHAWAKIFHAEQLRIGAMRQHICLDEGPHWWQFSWHWTTMNKSVSSCIPSHSCRHQWICSKPRSWKKWISEPWAAYSLRTTPKKCCCYWQPRSHRFSKQGLWTRNLVHVSEHPKILVRHGQELPSGQSLWVTKEVEIHEQELQEGADHGWLTDILFSSQLKFPQKEIENNVQKYLLKLVMRNNAPAFAVPTTPRFKLCSEQCLK